MKYDKKFYNTPLTELDPYRMRFPSDEMRYFRMRGLPADIYRGTIMRYSSAAAVEVLLPALLRQKSSYQWNVVRSRRSRGMEGKQDRSLGKFQIIVSTSPTITMSATGILGTNQPGFSYIDRVDGMYHFFENYAA